MFEDMGFAYMGPVDGHDVARLTAVLQAAKEEKRPVLGHVHTVKGAAAAPAQREPERFTASGRLTRQREKRKKRRGRRFPPCSGKTLTSLAREDERMCAITAAMGEGTGLTGFACMFPRRFFDVGIAEGHAVAMAGGMAKQGLTPVFAV